MIDPDREEIVSLTDAASFVAKKFGGRKPSQNTMARWCLNGLRGRRLESLKRGAQRVTSLEAIVRFFQRVADPELVSQGSRDASRDAEIERQLIAKGL